MRQLLKFFSVILSVIGLRRQASPIVILMYHRITGDTPLEIDLPFDTFKSQMHWLSSQRVISLDQALEELESGAQVSGFVITFDDAYRDFYTHAFPLLKKFNLPATLYVPTGFVDHLYDPPISRHIEHPERLQPVSWAMLRELAASPLVTIGSHTVSHRELPSLSNEEIAEELTTCDARLHDELGRPIDHFAYPRGVWDNRVEKLVVGRYRSVTVADNSQPKLVVSRLSRIPVLRSDGMTWFPHRIAGRLDLEARMVAGLKRLSASWRK